MQDATRKDAVLQTATADRTSDRLRRIADALEGAAQGPTLEELAAGLGRRAYGLLLLICSLGCAVPGPPGTGAVLAVPLIVLAFGMLMGRAHPHLPGALGRRRLPAAAVRSAVLRVNPVLIRLETWLRPRGLSGLPPSCLASRAVAQEIWTGALILILALLLALPVPLTNFPLGGAIVILALGLLERDAWATLIGSIAAFLAAALTLGMAGGTLALAAAALQISI